MAAVATNAAATVACVCIVIVIFGHVIMVIIIVVGVVVVVVVMGHVGSSDGRGCLLGVGSGAGGGCAHQRWLNVVEGGAEGVCTMVVILEGIACLFEPDRLVVAFVSLLSSLETRADDMVIVDTVHEDPSLGVVLRELRWGK